VIVAIGLAVLDSLDLVPDDWIAPITLAVLGLLAASMLRVRYKVEQLTAAQGQLFWEKHGDDLEKDLEQAKEVWLVGVTLSRTIKTNYALFERKLARGDTIRVLLVDPKGDGTEMAAGREYGGRFDAKRLRDLIRGSLDDLERLKQKAPDKLHVRVIDNPLTFGGVAVNPNDAAGVLYLEHYSYKMPGGSVPKFALRTTDGQWYGFFRDEMQALWENGVQP
jgi:hypothetical protein